MLSWVGLSLLVVLAVACTGEAKVQVIWLPLTLRSKLLSMLAGNVQETKVGIEGKPNHGSHHHRVQGLFDAGSKRQPIWRVPNREPQ